LVPKGPRDRRRDFIASNQSLWDDEFICHTASKGSEPMTITRLAPEARLSGAVIGGGLIWLAGQVADDSSLDTEGQTADILKQIDALLAEAGTDKRALLSATVVLADIRDAPAMNRAWDRWLDPAHKPARMTIQAALVDPAWKVEITGVALAP
jgi:enamine deaminase RidA (YjgF/YER057c/UK114 family)